MLFLFLDGPSRPLFVLFSSFQTNNFNIYDLKNIHGPLEFVATILPTEPQPIPHNQFLLQISNLNCFGHLPADSDRTLRLDFNT